MINLFLKNSLISELSALSLLEIVFNLTGSDVEKWGLR